jgi:hypothetical protein
MPLVLKWRIHLRTIRGQKLYVSRGDLRRLPAQHLQNDLLSTKTRQSWILVDVYSDLLERYRLVTRTVPPSDPDRRPTERSQLGH